MDFSPGWWYFGQYRMVSFQVPATSRRHFAHMAFTNNAVGWQEATIANSNSTRKFCYRPFTFYFEV
jgi:hypothetical protein